MYFYEVIIKLVPLDWYSGILVTCVEITIIKMDKKNINNDLKMFDFMKQVEN